MSQDPDKSSNLSVGASTASASINRYHSAPNYASQGEPDVSDGSEHIFSMYWEMVGEEDKKMVEGWKQDADRILVFTGLFSSTVTTLIAVSIQDIRPNSQDTTNFYLANIYQVLANTSRINTSLPSPPPFFPPRYAVWVNTFWFLSLVISLTCALLASLLQQWARRYLRATQRHHRLHKRARVRTFFSEGVDKFRLPWAFDALPMLLHISLFLFFAGLVVFLWKVDHTIFKLVLSLVGVCMALYGCITVLPFFRHDCPYYTPLTSLVWFIVIGTPYVVFWVLRWFTDLMPFSFETYTRFWALEKSYRKKLLHHVLKTAEETALSSAREIDARAFLLTFNKLDGDDQLERFFSGLPGFRSSTVVDDPLPLLTEPERLSIFGALFGLLDRTFLSNSLPLSDRNQRAIVCAKALEPIPYQDILDKIVSEDQYRGLKTTEFGHVVKSWGDGENQGAALVVQAIVTSIVATAQRRDDSWYQLASEELDVKEDDLRAYAADDQSLVILVHTIRQQFRNIQHQSLLYSLSIILKQGSKFNVQVASLDLKRGFCKLWNEIVLRAQRPVDRGTERELDRDPDLQRKLELERDLCKSLALNILSHIRNIYISLHEGTDCAPRQFSASTSDLDPILSQPSSYPSCNLSGHCLDSSLHGCDVKTSAFTSPTPTAPTFLPNDVAVQPTADCYTPSGVPDASLSPSPTLVKTSSSKNVLPIESHSSILALASGPSPSPISPDLSAADEEGTAKAPLRKEKDVPSAIRESIAAAPDQPQPPSSTSVTDPMAIAGSSRRSPHSSHDKYDMV